jgi:hypothetical protein
MRRIVFAVMAASVAIGWVSDAPACGSRLRIEALRVVAEYPTNPASVEKLREEGPEALDELLALRDELTARIGMENLRLPDEKNEQQRVAELQRRIARLDEIIDQVGKQRYCSRSRLYWHTDFDKAVQAARASGKPILSLRMLGNLHEDYSCANSRFFRTTLYANAEISDALRENFVLHWKSVRPVPKVTIDFGDGRKLERTVTGNSAHYILTPDGEVVDCLPGLYGPQAFLRRISAGLSVAQQVAAMSPADRTARLAKFHTERGRQLDGEFAGDMLKVGQIANVALDAPSARQQAVAAPAANVAAAIARPKMRIESRLVAAAMPAASMTLEDEAVWQKIAALHAEDAQIDDASRELIRSQNPTAAVAGRLAITKRIVEDPLVRLVRSLELSIALDTVKNEYRLHRQIHGWLADANYRPGINELNDRVYAELFLTPSSDPWLGLAPPDVYTALPNSGVVTSSGATQEK